MSFAKNMDKNIGKTISKSLSGTYRQKLLDHANQSATDAFKTSSKSVIQKTGEAIGGLIGNKIIDKSIKIIKRDSKVIQKHLQMSMIKKYLKKDIYLQKEDRKLLMN